MTSALNDCLIVQWLMKKLKLLLRLRSRRTEQKKSMCWLCEIETSLINSAESNCPEETLKRAKNLILIA